VSRAFLDVGDGLELRRLDPPDADVLQVIIETDRERLLPWMFWAESSTIDSTRAFIEQAVTNDRLDPLGIAVDGDLVGVVGADEDPISGNYSLGYWISSSHEGRGYVTRACSALIDHLFSVIGCHRVSLTVSVENPRSRAIAERLGLRQEGLLREAHRNDLGYQDVALYGILAQEWNAS